MADAVKFLKVSQAVNIVNAHYYTWYDADDDNTVDNQEIYLVTWKDTDGDNVLDHRVYYQMNDADADDMIEDGEMTLVEDYRPDDQKNDAVPNDIQPKNYAEDGVTVISYKTDEQDLQNFANWYSYYRRRELAAKAAIARVIKDLNQVYVGFYTINTGIRQTVLPVNVEIDSVVDDDTDVLLNLLYEMEPYEDLNPVWVYEQNEYITEDETPLREALNEVGRYYDQDDGDDGNLGASPFKDEEDGGACQQAIVIIITDGDYNGPDPGVGNEDGDAGEPYADEFSDTLADVAIKYYEEDLSDTLPDNLPATSYDDKNSQHMVTYSVSFGVSGTIDPTDIDGDGITDNPAYDDDPYFLNSETPVPDWPDPQAGDAEKIDDLWHAAVNGRGKFLNADDPEELVSSLNAVFANHTSKAASSASASVNGGELTVESVMYQSSYTPDNWEGDVTAYPIDSTTGDILTEESDILWRASEQLQLQDWDYDRRIVTYNGYDSILSFRYDNLTRIQQTAIGSNSDVVDYIRGREIEGFRSRDQKLGDIVHSAPLFVIGDSMDNNENGTIDEDGEEDGIIFVGGNDGMLHAFDAGTGDEIFAYIPHLVFDHLDELTSLTYDHKFYVDATPFSRTVTIYGDTIYADTMVLLTGGLKKGGKGYYCLDITRILYQNISDLTEDALSTPSHQDGVAVMWEYPSVTSGSDGDFGTADDEFGSDDDLGYSFSDIFIVESYKKDNSPGDHNWVAIFGNGYDSVNGSAVLYVLNAYTGEVIRKIDAGVSGDNGLSSPALIDTDNDGKVDYAYAGDLKGNMWKFDLTDAEADNWKVSYLETDGVTPAPLFKSENQPITSAPDVMNHCEDDSGYMVLFGTGKFIGESDWTNIDQQTIYGLWDLGYPLGEWTESSGTLSRMVGATLLEQTEIDFQYLSGNYLRTLSDNSATWVELSISGGVISGTHIGWYFDLPMDGERVIEDVLIRDGHLIALTFTPDDTFCTAGGGLSMVMEMNACDSSRLDDAQLDINGDGVIDENDYITIIDPNDPTNTIVVAPTGIGYYGLLSLPVIVTMPEGTTEMKIFSSSEGTIEQILENAEGGFYYWSEIKN